MKKNLAYFLGISSNLAFAAGNVALGINKHSVNNDYDIVIYYSDLTGKDEASLKKIPHCILKKFVLDSKFVDFMMHELPDKCRFRTYERLMCYSHYEAFALLDEYKHVIWLDADILIQEDIEPLVKWGPLGFSEDGKRRVADQFVDEPKCFYNLSAKAIQIGLMVLDDTIPYWEMYQFCYDKSWEYARYSLNPEQAVINLMLQEFKMEPKIIPEYIHCDCRSNIAPRAWIVHFGTDVKVWNDYGRFDAFPEWYRNHKKWITLGGTESKEYTVTIRPPRNLMEVVRIQNEYSFLLYQIPRGSKVVIYGGGGVGHLYVEQLNKTGYCTVIAVLDKNADKITGLGELVFFPEKVKEIVGYDYVVIAMEDREKILEVRKLLGRLNVPSNKIVSK